MKVASAVVVALLAGCASQPTVAPDLDALRAEVDATERAFARTMADRDHAAFTDFLAPDAVFINGRTPIVGRDAIAADWARFFEGPDAPFSWEPDLVVVLASGGLANSSGPVYAPDGQLIARFQSVWRREPGGAWRIVFDQGCPVCPPR